MKAITIKQPWASLIIEGGKDIENRTRRTHVRGWVLVHAGLNPSQADFLNARQLVMSGSAPLFNRQAVVDLLWAKYDWSFDKDAWSAGGIIGAMHITDCVEASDSPWFCGPFGYVIDRVVKLPFLPCRGHQGWFNVELPPETEALIPKV